MLLPMILSFALAQEVKIKEDMKDKQFSTIEVRKKHSISPDFTYKIEDGTENVEGDTYPLTKDARDSWKKACKEWKKDFTDRNRGNQVISLDCGKMDCTTQTVETTCRSNAKYKIKVKMVGNETDNASEPDHD